MRLQNLKGLVRLWCHHLAPAEFRLVAYFYRWAAAAPDGLVRRSRQEIARATKIRMRDVRPMLKRLKGRGILQVESLAGQETVVKIPLENWLVPAAVLPVKPPATAAAIKELVLRLCGRRVGFEQIEELKQLAGVDEKDLVEVLDALLRRSPGFEPWVLFQAALVHEAALLKGTCELRPSFPRRHLYRDPGLAVGGLVDEWLQKLTRSEFKIAMYLFTATSDSLDGLAAHSIHEIADHTNLSSRTVISVVHALEARGVIQVVSNDKERTLIRFPESLDRFCLSCCPGPVANR